MRRSLCAVFPLDIILLVLEHYADQSTLYHLGMTCRCLSPHAIQQLWHMPYITSLESLNGLSATLTLSAPLYPYMDWISGLALHFQYNKNYQLISNPILFSSLIPLRLEILSLSNIHITPESNESFQNFMAAQLDQGLSEFHQYNCTIVTVDMVVSALQYKERPFLRRLCFYDCHLTDHHIDLMARTCGYLHTLFLERCGCLSDTSMLAIAYHCQQLQTLVVTLPSNIIQSNTITVKTLEALEKHCLSLKHFVCGGQIRISEYTSASTTNDNNNSNNNNHHFQITIPTDSYLSWS